MVSRKIQNAEVEIPETSNVSEKIHSELFYKKIVADIYKLSEVKIQNAGVEIPQTSNVSSENHLEMLYKKKVADFYKWFQEKIKNTGIEIPETSNASAENHEYIRNKLQPWQSTEKIIHLMHNKRRRRASSWPSESIRKSFFEEIFQDLLKSSTSKIQSGEPSIPKDNNCQESISSLKTGISNEQNMAINDDVKIHRDIPQKNDTKDWKLDNKSSMDTHERIRNKHFPVEENKCIRRSDFESSYSLPKFVNRLLSPNAEQSRSTIGSSTTRAPENSIVPDVCSSQTHSFHSKQICSENSQHKLAPPILPHLIQKPQVTDE
ncbi:hypothetical protein CEXT_333601 [Caerostris extrusa]|uniref:Uncharacterized protein n=1 Tax=Caerostris extrusa TaxID=172846 RepID=A0AAV4NAS0_CAEEX|nr:hypothetical protein CEXT_333601 [Caerostris extrusa]